MLNFYSIVIYGCTLLAITLIYFIWRDSKKTGLFFNKHKSLGFSLGFILGIGILILLYAHLIEPNLLLIKKSGIESDKINQPIKIAFIADLQVGNHKKYEFVQKIVQKIIGLQPNLILLGGDLIDNEGTFKDESIYLESLSQLVGPFPIYYILGNHEYGVGAYTQNTPGLQTGDKSDWLIKKMEKLGIPLLRNELECLNINSQNICIFGADDIWHTDIDYAELYNCYSDPLADGEKSIDPSSKSPQDDTCLKSFTIFLTHNPDGILSYPENLTPPDLILAGHTHGGQIYLPFLGPLGDPNVNLPKKYWRGLNYYNGIPMLTSVGVGESGGQIRLLSPPTIELITLQ